MIMTIRSAFYIIIKIQLNPCVRAMRVCSVCWKIVEYIEQSRKAELVGNVRKVNTNSSRSVCRRERASLACLARQPRKGGGGGTELEWQWWCVNRKLHSGRMEFTNSKDSERNEAQIKSLGRCQWLCILHWSHLPSLSPAPSCLIDFGNHKNPPWLGFFLLKLSRGRDRSWENSN